MLLSHIKIMLPTFGDYVPPELAFGNMICSRRGEYHLPNINCSIKTLIAALKEFILNCAYNVNFLQIKKLQIKT